MKEGVKSDSDKACCVDVDGAGVGELWSSFS